MERSLRDFFGVHWNHSNTTRLRMDKKQMTPLLMVLFETVLLEDADDLSRLESLSARHGSNGDGRKEEVIGIGNGFAQVAQDLNVPRDGLNGHLPRVLQVSAPGDATG